MNASSLFVLEEVAVRDDHRVALWECVILIMIVHAHGSSAVLHITHCTIDYTGTIPALGTRTTMAAGFVGFYEGSPRFCA